jgi:hypothetical protein
VSLIKEGVRVPERWIEFTSTDGRENATEFHPLPRERAG